MNAADAAKFRELVAAGVPAEVVARKARTRYVCQLHGRNDPLSRSAAAVRDLDFELDRLDLDIALQRRMIHADTAARMERLGIDTSRFAAPPLPRVCETRCARHPSPDELGRRALSQMVEVMDA